MQRSTLSVLACPACRRAYSPIGQGAEDGDIIDGALVCDGCGIVIPIGRGFAFFTEPRLHGGLASPEALAKLDQDLFGQSAAYQAYRAQKDERNLWESYAAFHPFNESVRAAEPLLPLIRAHLKPGEAILDTWGR